METLGEDIDGKEVKVGSRIIYGVSGRHGAELRRANVIGLASNCNNCYGKLHLRVWEDGGQKPTTFHYGEKCLVMQEA